MREIKTLKSLIIPLAIGVSILIIGIIWNRLGSKRPTPQTLSFFVCIAGIFLTIVNCYYIFKFRKYRKSTGLEIITKEDRKKGGVGNSDNWMHMTGGDAP